MAKTTFSVPDGRQEVVMTRVFNAPREHVWRAMTDPELVAKWWGPSYLTTTIDEMDARPGGRWRFIQRDPDGHEFAFHGFYHLVQEPELVVQTFEFEGLPERHVLMETGRLEESDGTTLFTQTSVYQSVADRDGMVQSGMESGSTESMERLTELIDTLR